MITRAERIFDKATVPVWSLISMPISRSAAYLTAKVLDNLDSNSKILDVGVGTGRTATRLAWRFNVDGIDASRAMLARTRVPESVHLFYGEADNLPFEANVYNAVVYNYVLRYVDINQKDAVLKEAYRVLKKGGRVVIADLSLPRLRPNNQKLEHSLDAKVLGIWSMMSRQDFKDAMQSLGFRYVKTLYPLVSFMMVFEKE